MTTNTEPIKYLLDIINEPDEEPVRLTQEDFDQLVRLGKSLEPDHIPDPEAQKRLVDFATLETVEGTDTFMFEGQEIDSEEAALYCGLGLMQAIRDLLDEYRAAG